MDDTCLPGREIALLDMFSCVADESQVERQIVNACYLHGKQFLCLEQMVQIGFGVESVYLAAVGING